MSTNHSTNKAYHERYGHLHPQLIANTKKFWRAHPLRGTDEHRMELLQSWTKFASDIYKVPKPHLVYDPTNPNNEVLYAMTGGGAYNPRTQTINLYKLSVTTLFHEYRHHLQATKGLALSEPDARAWSLSLFYRTRRKLFTKSVADGKIRFVTIEQLTKPTKRTKKGA